VMRSFVALLGIVTFAYCAWDVLAGVRSGVIEPMTRGWTWQEQRARRPWAFWTAVAWNAAIGLVALFASIQIMRGL
jgi:hypothetical protein